jgi:hypothetical protein
MRFGAFLGTKDETDLLPEVETLRAELDATDQRGQSNGAAAGLA